MRAKERRLAGISRENPPSADAQRDGKEDIQFGTEPCEGGFDLRHKVLGHQPLKEQVIQDPTANVVAFFRDPRQVMVVYILTYIHTYI